MPIDAYSPCPGGLDKKIKFCCPDLLGDWQKIDRMLDGEQYQACLQHVNRLLEKQGVRACLLATKCQLLRVLGEDDEADRTAAAFVEKFPESALALAESALSAVAGPEGGPAAVEKLLRAFQASGQAIHMRVYEIADQIARVLVVQGHFESARALATTLLSLQPDDEEVLEFFIRLNSSSAIPLLIKDHRPLEGGPDGAPWKDACNSAIQSATELCWKEAHDKMLALAAQYGDPPAIWRNVATLRGWLADAQGEAEALHRYASLDVPWEDAMEAEAAALLLAEDPLKDAADVVRLSYEVDDVDALQVTLASSPYVESMRQDLRQYGEEDGPPPKAGFLLFSGPRPTPDAPVDPRTFPRLLTQFLLFGKQTDRPARLESQIVPGSDLDEVKRLLAEIAGGQLGAASEQVQGRTSTTRTVLRRVLRIWEDATAEQMEQLVEQYFERTVLEIWPERPLGYLDDKSPRQAAADAAYRIRLLAAIMLMEYWTEQNRHQFDFNRLRSSLGLPTLDPIDPEGLALNRLPPVRLARVMVEKLSDDDLVWLYRAAVTYHARIAIKRFAEAIVERPSLAGREESLQSYHLLASIAEHPDEALRWIERGRQASDALGQSNARWDLMELPVRVGRGEAAEFSRLVDHLRRQHVREPGVMESLTRLFIDLGLLNPDGTPVVPAGPAPAAEAPGIVVPGGEEAGKLWTPEGQQQASGQKSGLWTPGMD